MTCVLRTERYEFFITKIRIDYVIKYTFNPFLIISPLTQLQWVYLMFSQN